MRTPARAWRARIRRLHARIQSPSDAFLVARLLGWRLAVPVLKRALPIDRLIRLMRSGSPDAAGESHRIIEFVDWIYAPRREPEPGNCLDRSLVLYRFLSANEPGAQLVLGIRRESGALEVHAWVIVGGHPLGAVPPRGERFVPLAAFDAQGRRVESAEWR